MPGVCVRCSHPVTTASCPTCGAEQPVDPLVGAVVTERYEIIELLSVGGMARLYRATQRSLNRTVVVKVVDPVLLSGDEESAEEAVQRFMVEAQAASRLNHPNVVSVIDFGKVPESEGGYLFLVMEYLAGRDLRMVLDQDPPLEFPRIASILRQTLAALIEAHLLGITHRDVKPENILLEPRRRGDLVKVIDFGLAKLGSNQSVTRVGKTLGTPHYMAPEQIRGDALGSGDLYAVGVILYEMLTGEVPFDGSTPIEIMQKHISAPRPDPRAVVGRDIPANIAEICMRSMACEPADRYPTAEAFSDALEEASGGALSERMSLQGMSFPPPSMSLPPPAPTGQALRAPKSAAPEIEISIGEEDFDLSESLGPELVGRDADLAWGSQMLDDPAVTAVVFTGPPGIGRTRMALELGALAELEGAVVVRAHPPARPLQEVGFTTLRMLVSQLADTTPDAAVLASGTIATEPPVAAGLRAIFGGEVTKGASGPVQTRRNVSLVLAWALRRAHDRSDGAPVVLVVDDLDRVDGVSRKALIDVLARPQPVPWTLVTTCQEEDVELPPECCVSRALLPLSPANAAVLRQGLRRTTTGGPLLPRDAEPLFVALLNCWGLDRAGARPPASLDKLIEWRVLSLKPAERRLLLAIAVTGGGTTGELAALTRANDLDEALEPLIAFSVVERGVDHRISVAHDIFARIALGVAPSGAVAEVRKTVCDALAARDGVVELRAYHAIRTQPDFETFMLVEDCAALRSARGDDAAAIAVLKEGFRAGHDLLARGDAMTGKSACVVFGQKLAASLSKIGEHDAAIAVLKEALALLTPGDPTRGAVLDELSRLAVRLGLPDADRYRREAAAIRKRPLER